MANNKTTLLIVTPLTLCWAYTLTHNVRVIPLTLLFMLFIFMGFVLLKAFYDHPLQLDFSVLGLSFGIFMVVFSVIGIPSLVFHLSHTIFFAAEIGVISALLIFSIVYIIKNRDNRDTLKIKACRDINRDRDGRIEETKAPARFFLIIVVIDILAGVIFFRSDKFMSEGYRQTVFYLLIILNFLVSVYFAYTYRTKAEYPRIPESQVVSAALMVMAAILLSLISYLAICNLYLDADDCTYISATLNFKNSTKMNMYEPSLGCQLKQFPGSLVMLWELFMSFVSDLSFISPVELYQYFLYPILYIIVLSSVYFLFQQIFRNRQDALLAMVLYLVYNIKSIDYHKSISKFFMLRLHQPKSILNFIFYPLAMAVLIRYLREKKIKDLVMFSLLLFVAYAIHPFALFMFFFSTVAILLFYVPHHFSWLNLKKYLLLNIPFGAIGLIGLYQNSLIGQEGLGYIVSGYDFVSRNELFYQSQTKLLIIIFLPLFIYYCSDRSTFAYLFGTSIIIGFVCFYNPIYIFMVNILGQITWRVIEFIIPQSLILIWILILWKNYLSKGLATLKFTGGNRRLCSMAAVFITIFLMGGYHFRSSSIWASENLKRISNHSRIEIKARQVLEIINAYKTERKIQNITVLLPLEIAWIAPTYIQNLKTPVSRLQIAYSYYKRNNRLHEGLKVIENYKRFYNGTMTDSEWISFRNKFDFDIIVNNVAGGKNDFFLKHVIKEYKEIFTNESYTVFCSQRCIVE